MARPDPRRRTIWLRGGAIASLLISLVALLHIPWLLLGLLPLAVATWYQLDTLENTPPTEEELEALRATNVALPPRPTREDAEPDRLALEPARPADGAATSPWPSYDEDTDAPAEANNAFYPWGPAGQHQPAPQSPRPAPPHPPILPRPSSWPGYPDQRRPDPH